MDAGKSSSVTDCQFDSSERLKLKNPSVTRTNPTKSYPYPDDLTADCAILVHKIYTWGFRPITVPLGSRLGIVIPLINSMVFAHDQHGDEDPICKRLVITVDPIEESPRLKFTQLGHPRSDTRVTCNTALSPFIWELMLGFSCHQIHCLRCACGLGAWRACPSDGARVGHMGVLDGVTKFQTLANAQPPHVDECQLKHYLEYGDSSNPSLRLR